MSEALAKAVNDSIVDRLTKDIEEALRQMPLLERSDAPPLPLEVAAVNYRRAVENSNVAFRYYCAVIDAKQQDDISKAEKLSEKAAYVRYHMLKLLDAVIMREFDAQLAKRK